MLFCRRVQQGARHGVAVPKWGSATTSALAVSLQGWCSSGGFDRVWCTWPPPLALPTVTLLPPPTFAAWPFLPPPRASAGRAGLHPVSSPPPAEGYVRGGSKQGAPPALAGVRDRDISSGICSMPCMSPIPVGRRLCLHVPRERRLWLCQPGAAAFTQAMVAVLLPIGLPRVFQRHWSTVRVHRYRITRVLDGTGLPTPSLPHGEQNTLLTLLQEMWGWQLALSSHQEAPGN